MRREKERLEETQREMQMQAERQIKEAQIKIEKDQEVYRKQMAEQEAQHQRLINE
jgi:hypothetical protein